MKYCIFCLDFFKSRPILVLVVSKFFILAYILFLYRSSIVLGIYGPYASTGGFGAMGGLSALTVQRFIGDVAGKFGPVFFLLSLLMGIESSVHFYGMVEKKYAVLNAMGGETLQEHMVKALSFDSAYELVFSILAGFTAGLPVLAFGLDLNWILYSVLVGLGLFASWLGVFALIVGFARDRATGITGYLITSLLLYYATTAARGSGNFYNFTLLAAQHTVPWYTLYKTHLPGYPLIILLALTAAGLASAAWGVSRFEVN